MGKAVAKGCLITFAAVIGLAIVIQIASELWFRRTANQIAIIDKSVGGFSCDAASIIEADWNPMLFHVDFRDEIRIAMPADCVAALQATVTANPTFHFGDCTQADRCWTNMGLNGGEYVEFHFLEREIIFRHGRM